MTAVQVRQIQSTTAGSRALLATTGTALIASGAAQLADEFFAGPTAEIADTALFRAGAALHLVAFALLAVSVSVIAARGWAGSGTGSRLVVGLLWAGTLLAVCAMWSGLFVDPLLAEIAPELVNSEPAVGNDLALGTFVLALLALAVASLRAGRVSRRTVSLLLASGLLFVVVPAAQLVVGLALLSGRNDGVDEDDVAGNDS